MTGRSYREQSTTSVAQNVSADKRRASLVLLLLLLLPANRAQIRHPALASEPSRIHAKADPPAVCADRFRPAFLWSVGPSLASRSSLPVKKLCSTARDLCVWYSP